MRGQFLEIPWRNWSQLDGECIEELRVNEKEKENEGPVPGNPLEELVSPGGCLQSSLQRDQEEEKNTHKKHELKSRLTGKYKISKKEDKNQPAIIQYLMKTHCVSEEGDAASRMESELNELKSKDEVKDVNAKIKVSMKGGKECRMDEVKNFACRKEKNNGMNRKVCEEKEKNKNLRSKISETHMLHQQIENMSIKRQK